MRFNSPVYLSLVLLLASSFASADWTKTPSSAFTISAPPKEGSAAYKEDFELLIQHQESDRDAECKLAARQLYPNYDAFFGASSGILSAAELESAEEVVEKSMKLSERIASYFKGKFTRPRPFNVDESIEPCIEKPSGSKSYPSSHAAAAATGACVLAKLYPDKARELRAYGRYLGDVRFIVGVHHPSDVRAGQKLGMEICEHLLADEEFQNDLHGR